VPERADRVPDRDPRAIIREKDRENAALRGRLERVERERDQLRRENERLKEELEAARRAGARQAAPFSKGAPKRRPRRPGRKPGAAYGRRGQRAVPTVVHETHDVPVPTTCPDCGGQAGSPLFSSRSRHSERAFDPQRDHNESHTRKSDSSQTFLF
jgi:hypothetical protein